MVLCESSSSESSEDSSKSLDRLRLPSLTIDNSLISIVDSLVTIEKSLRLEKFRVVLDMIENKVVLWFTSLKEVVWDSIAISKDVLQISE